MHFVYFIISNIGIDNMTQYVQICELPIIIIFLHSLKILLAALIIVCHPVLKNTINFRVV